MIKLNYKFPEMPKIVGAGFFVSRGIGIHPERVIDNYEIIFVRRGTLWINENEIDYKVSAGEILILEPGLNHKGTKNYDNDLNFYWLHFILPKDNKSEETYNIPKIVNIKDKDRLTLLFRDITLAWQSDSLLDTHGSLQLLLLLEEITNSNKKTTKKNHLNETLANKIHNYINRYIYKDITRKSLSKDLDYNADYLSRVYFSSYNTTITNAIHNAKINRAKILLAESDYNIEEISYKCGFNDSNYFRRTFKQIVDLSPLEYRHRYSAIFEINT